MQYEVKHKPKSGSGSVARKEYDAALSKASISMDTAKAANLFANYPEADLYEFINAPIGKGRPIDKKLSPLIASVSIASRLMVVANG